MALVQDVWTAPAIQNQNTGSGTSARLVYCRSVLESPPEVPSQVLPSQSWRSFQKCHLTRCDSPFGHSFRPMQRGITARTQHFGSGTSKAVGSRRSGTEPPREEIACAGRSLGAPAWPSGTLSSRLLRSSPNPARRRPYVGRGRKPPSINSRQRSQYCGVPKRDRLRHGRSGELRAQCCEFSEKQTIFHVTSLPCHHFTTPLHAPNHSNFLTPSQCNFLQNRVTASSAVQHGRLGFASALSGARSLQNGHATSHRAAAGGRAAQAAPAARRRTRCAEQRSRQDRGFGQRAPPASSPSRRKAQQRRVGAVRSNARRAGQYSEGYKPQDKPRLGDRRPVPPRGSVLQPGGVTLAAVASRSVAVQTEDSVKGSLSLWDWLFFFATATAIQTLDDGRSSHQWRSIQEQQWSELQKV